MDIIDIKRKTGNAWNPYLYNWCGVRDGGQPSLTRPTKDRLYIKILLKLNEDSLWHTTKRDIYDAIGMETTPTHYHNCVWRSLRNAGFLDMERIGNAYKYKITKKGKDYLKYYGFIEVNLMEVELW